MWGSLFLIRRGKQTFICLEKYLECKKVVTGGVGVESWKRAVKIWGDRWILTPSTYAIQSPPRVLDVKAIYGK